LKPVCDLAPVRQREAIVIGAGPGGLAAAAMLRRRGVDCVVVDRADTVGASWRRHYDRLHLHTVRWLSHLPGYRFSRRHGRWVSRDGVVRYLEGYARHHELELMLGTAVERVDRSADGDGFVLRTPGGDLPARHVVVATGYNNTPSMPDWPGRDGFGGDLVHAADYRNAEPYRGRDVLVVGAGNTGAEIAVDLVEGGAGRVRMAIRTPPHVVLRESNGLPTQATGVVMRRVPTRIGDPIAAAVGRMTVGDLEPYGIGKPPRGLYTRAIKEQAIPIIDVGLIEQLKDGKVEVVGAVEGFDGASVLIAGGERIDPEVVIVATGWSRALEPLVGHLGVLGADGRPVAHGGQTPPEAPGLYFTGFVNPVSGMFREMGIDARRIARAVAKRARATA
jgi:putative flavoprotein involved in K+ transport